MVRELRGILSAVSTPFNDDQTKVEESALRELVDGQIEAGIHGLIPCGGTGEFVTLTVEERKQVTEVVADQTRGRVTVVPHTGHLSTAVAVDLSRHAESVGADAVMVMYPFGEPVGLEEIYQYYKDISDAIHIPIMMYNIPSVTGQNLTPAYMAQMAREIENVKYVKDSSGDLTQISTLLYDYADVITAFNGWDTITFSGLALGAKGSVWGAPNVMPRECAQLFDLTAAGRLNEAKALWDRMWPVMEFLCTRSYNAAVKAGANLYGFRCGNPRRPTLPIPANEVEELKQLMIKAGVLR